MNIIQLAKIFAKHKNRSLFINEYRSFNEDDNDVFFVNFIDNSINLTTSKAQEDAIELSITLHVYKDEYLKQITQILKSRRSEWIKLLCLDWLFNFYLEVPAPLFKDINSFLLSKSEIDILKIQAIINLILSDKLTNSIKNYLTSLIVKTTDNAVFYRLINVLEHNFFQDVKSELIEIISNGLALNFDLDRKQKAILTTKVSTFY